MTGVITNSAQIQAISPHSEIRRATKVRNEGPTLHHHPLYLGDLFPVDKPELKTALTLAEELSRRYLTDRRKLYQIYLRYAKEKPSSRSYMQEK